MATLNSAIWNAITVERQDGESRLTRCLGHPPIKFINPRPAAGSCQVYVSNYGGGLVDGDEVRMHVECHPGSRLYLGTQSSTKVYKGNGRNGCLQETVGMLHANARAVICPDPVVPFAGSRYRQVQAWDVHPEADLVLIDWLQPGRSARGEVFAYEAFRSEIRVARPDGTPILAERFGVEPGTRDPLLCGRFGNFRSMLTACLMGPNALSLGDALETTLLAVNRPGKAWVGMGRKDGAGWLVRALGVDRRDIQPVQDAIFAALMDAAWLGFNPWHRRW